MLRAEEHLVNRKRARRLMRKIGIAALGPRPRTTCAGPLSLARSSDRAAEPGLVRRHHIYMPIGRAPGREIFHYLLRGLAIERPNQSGAPTSHI